MKMTIRLSEKGPERLGFWSAGKGEFEQSWTGLEKLIQEGGGFPLEFLDQMRTDRWFASRVALFITNGGIMPSEEETRASTTGVRIITQGQARRVLTWMTGFRSTFLSEISPTPVPFSNELLHKYAKTHVLFPGPPAPMSLLAMELLLPGYDKGERGDGYPYWLKPGYESCTKKHRFYEAEKMGPDWYLMGIEPLKETSNIVPKEMGAKIPQGERMPLACEVIYMTILWNYVVRTMLFPGISIVTASGSDHDTPMPVGVVDCVGEWRGWKHVFGSCTCADEKVMTITSVDSDM